MLALYIKCLLEKNNIVIVRMSWVEVNEVSRRHGGHAILLGLYPDFKGGKNIKSIQVTYFNPWGIYEEKYPSLLSGVNTLIASLLSKVSFEYPNGVNINKLVRGTFTMANNITFIFTPYDGHHLQGPYLDDTGICWMLCELFIYQLVSETVLNPKDALLNFDGRTIINNLFNFSLTISSLSWFHQQIINNKVRAFYYYIINPILESKEEITIDNIDQWLKHSWLQYYNNFFGRNSGGESEYSRWITAFIKNNQKYQNLLDNIIPPPPMYINLKLSETTLEDLNKCCCPPGIICPCPSPGPSPAYACPICKSPANAGGCGCE